MKTLFRKFVKKLPFLGRNIEVEQIQSAATENSILDLNIEGIMPNRYKISSTGKIIDSELNIVVDVSYRNNIGRVALYTESGKTKEYSLNRLIAAMFLPKTEKDVLYNRNIVHVKDWNNRNHNVENLQWSNQSEIYIYVNFYKNNRRDREYEKLYIEMLIRRNYNFNDILDVIPFTTPMHDIVAIYGDLKI